MVKENVTFLTLQLTPNLTIPVPPHVEGLEYRKDQISSWIDSLGMKLLSLIFFFITYQLPTLLVPKCSGDHPQNDEVEKRSHKIDIQLSKCQAIDPPSLVSCRDCRIFLNDITCSLASPRSESPRTTCNKASSDCIDRSNTPPTIVAYVHPVWKKRGPMHWDQTFTPIS